MSPSNSNKKLQSFVLVFIAFLVIAGSINTISDKFQNRQSVVQGGIQKQFYHPYMQTLVMYFSIFFSYPLFRFLKSRNPDEYEKRKALAVQAGKVEFEKKILIRYIFFDITAVTLQSIALNFIPASSYQMMRGGAIITTFFFSIVWLKMKAQKNQIVGTSLAFIGILLVGLSSLLFSNEGGSIYSTELQLIGYILVISSLFMNGFCYIFQENALRTYAIEPMQLIGYQSGSCLIVYIIIVIIFTFIPCGFGKEACVYDTTGTAYLQRPQQYFKQLGDNGGLLAVCIIQFFSILTFNICAISITNYINGLARAVCDVIRTAVIWLFGIIITLTAGKQNKTYKWQSLQVGPICLQLTGFIILITGNLIYNRIVQFDCLKGEEVNESNDQLVDQSSSNDQISR